MVYYTYLENGLHLQILDHFSILDVRYNSNFLGVDVKGRCRFIFGASHRHHRFRWMEGCDPDLV